MGRVNRRNDAQKQPVLEIGARILGIPGTKFTEMANYSVKTDRRPNWRSGTLGVTPILRIAGFGPASLALSPWPSG